VFFDVFLASDLGKRRPNPLQRKISSKFYVIFYKKRVNFKKFIEFEKK